MVTGKTKWKTDLRLKPLSEVVTESDEAFTLIILENNWDFWTNMVAQRSSEDEGSEVDGWRWMENQKKYLGYSSKMDGQVKILS